ncbi:MHYT domain-containing protein [Nocardia terpenica]|uniref:MHYT domain-containing protein n=1 Tax=Nocardia terpenica TaxID=455432 RepID=A0A164JP89_9NOCA|nr:MHYT domain-containing protein [Nocardia terpenica]KZM70593.1 hypothetical protein AWN90_39110 [Nocardia terpenica]NQE90161.1 hypothetical protein [Nocardia terpenica]
MTYFALGYWVLGLALGVSASGALIGLACIRQSTLSVTARFRLVWQAAAAVSIGSVGIWLAMYVTMLGVGVPKGALSYDLPRTAAAALLAGASIMAGLLAAGKTLHPVRLAGGGVLAGLGIGLMHYLALTAIQVQGSVTINALSAITVIVLAIVIATATLWATLRLRSLAALTGVAVAFALATAGMHYLGLAGVSLHLDSAAPRPAGEDLFTLFVPVFVLGTLSLAVPITAVLVAPDRSTTVRPGRRLSDPTDEPGRQLVR